MPNVWIITRHLDDAIASTINVDDLTVDKARIYEAMMIKAGFERLGANTKFMKLIGDIGSPDNIVRMKSSLPDIAVIAFTLWNSGYETKILEELEYQGVLVINSSKTHFVCNNKLLQYNRLTSLNVKIPKTLDIHKNMTTDSMVETIESEIGYPVVIKPKFGSSGAYTVRCNNANEIKNACFDILFDHKYKHAIAQKWIDHNPHGLINVVAIGGEIVSCFNRIPEIETDFWNTGTIVYDHVLRLVDDKKISSAKLKIATSDPTKDLFDPSKPRGLNDLRDEYPITDELKTFVKSACAALYNADIVRMDILKNDEGYMICEVNSPAGYPGHDIFYGKDCGYLFAKYCMDRL